MKSCIPLTSSKFIIHHKFNFLLTQAYLVLYPVTFINDNVETLDATSLKGKNNLYYSCLIRHDIIAIPKVMRYSCFSSFLFPVPS